MRYRILSSSSGTSPASPASSASAPAKDADDASDAGDVAHAGEKNLNSERGGKISGGKGEDLGKKMPGNLSWGEQALRGNGGTGSQTGKGEKNFGKRRVEILGGKALGGKRGKGC